VVSKDEDLGAVVQTDKLVINYFPLECADCESRYQGPKVCQLSALAEQYGQVTNELVEETGGLSCSIYLSNLSSDDLDSILYTTLNGFEEDLDI